MVRNAVPTIYENCLIGYSYTNDGIFVRTQYVMYHTHRMLNCTQSITTNSIATVQLRPSTSFIKQFVAQMLRKIVYLGVLTQTKACLHVHYILSTTYNIQRVLNCVWHTTGINIAIIEIINIVHQIYIYSRIPTTMHNCLIECSHTIDDKFAHT